MCLLLALALAAGAQLIATRGENGLERYRLDRLAERAALTAAPLGEAYCRELGGRLAMAPCTAPPGGPAPQLPSRAEMDAFAARLVTRYQAVDDALAALTRGGVDWRVVSEGFAAEPDDETLKARLREAWAEFDRVRDEAQGIGQLMRRVDRGALAQAVAFERSAYDAAAQRAEWPAAGAALLRWTRLLDGTGDAAAARTVAYLLNAGYIAERARQAEALVRHGAPLWLGWAAWLWLAARLGRRAVRPLPTLALLVALALALAGAEQHWLDVRLPRPAWWGAGLLAGFALTLDQWGAARGWAWTDALPRRVTASPWLIPGWLLFVGIGWLLLADLSLHFHPRLRFLLVDHFAGVWAAVLLLGLLPLLAGPAIGVLAGLLGHAGAPTAGGRVLGGALLLLLPASAWLAASDGVRLPQHYTGEVFKAIAVIAVAWFLLLRGPLLRSGALTPNLRGWVAASLPAAFPLLAFAAAFALTRDLGPLLVVLLCVLIWAGAFVGWRVMIGGLVLALGGLFVAGGLISPIVAERVRSVLDPFSSKTDDLARLIWFQQEVPATGFGLGQAPWCGYAAEERCLGLPLQTQSDYTFTALMGVAGQWAWLVVALMGLWAVVLMRSHWRAEVHPCALIATPHAVHEGLRAWLAVAFGTLVAVQLGGTVAGNLAWIPLSGITLPYMSFGSAALFTMTGFLAVLADRSVPVEDEHHA